ncbi:fibronectin type III domain-containing protein [Piscinibacter terrae]|nr:fibronectin type III domain-containing protein [Albitalea terrae]
MSLTAVLVAAMLSACGGGNGASDSTSTPSEVPTPSTPTPSTPTPPTPAPTTGSITLSWTAPTTNSDGSAISDLAGYRVYYGTASGFYTDNVTIDNPSTLTATISNLPADTYYVIVRAFNSVNSESLASVEVSKTIK